VSEGTGKLLIVRVPKGASPPYGTAQGLYKKRVGKNCMPLDSASFAKWQISTGAIDWSGYMAEGVVLNDLDPVEIARARNILQRINSGSDLLKLDDHAFLKEISMSVSRLLANNGRRHLIFMDYEESENGVLDICKTLCLLNWDDWRPISRVLRAFRNMTALEMQWSHRVLEMSGLLPQPRRDSAPKE
jgi:hypothetical protein